MPDKENLASFGELPPGLDMNLGDERAGGVEHEHAPARGGVGHRLRHAVGGKDDRRVGLRDLVELLDEDRALGLELLDHGAVVHDGVAHIDRRAISLERELDDLDGPVHPGAKAPRGRQIDGELGAINRPPV